MRQLMVAAQFAQQRGLTRTRTDARIGAGRPVLVSMNHMAVPEALEPFHVGEPHAAGVRQVDQPKHLELGERAADRLNGEAKEVGNVGARHRQVDDAGILAVAGVTAGQREQEGNEPFCGAALAGGKQQLASAASSLASASPCGDRALRHWG